MKFLFKILALCVFLLLQTNVYAAPAPYADQLGPAKTQALAIWDDPNFQKWFYDVRMKEYVDTPLSDMTFQEFQDIMVPAAKAAIENTTYSGDINKFFVNQGNMVGFANAVFECKTAETFINSSVILSLDGESCPPYGSCLVSTLVHESQHGADYAASAAGYGPVPPNGMFGASWDGTQNIEYSHCATGALMLGYSTNVSSCQMDGADIYMAMEEDLDQNIFNTVKDIDNDGLPNDCKTGEPGCIEDMDDDGDGVSDDDEWFNGSNPYAKDSDSDGKDDKADALPYDSTESRDFDGDGVGDNRDAYPYDKTKQSYSDKNENGFPDELELGIEKYSPIETDYNDDGIPDTPVDGDSDHDGLKDSLEPAFCIGKWDCDYDNVPDGVEANQAIDRYGLANASDSEKQKTIEKYISNPKDDVEPLLDDPDGDGLGPATEWKLGTSNSGADGDGDGVPDGYDTDGDGVTDSEDIAPTNAGLKCADLDNDGLDDTLLLEDDKDGDGITNIGDGNCPKVEGYVSCLYCSLDKNETEPDYDCDWLGTYFETQHGMNPKNVDSDNDGLQDGEEFEVIIEHKMCGQISYPIKYAIYQKFNPNKADTDDDGVPDSLEKCDWPTFLSLIPNVLGPLGDIDGDGQCNKCDADMDGDMLTNIEESAASPLFASNFWKPDTDGDLIDDGNDNCRNIYNPDQKDTDGIVKGEGKLGDACDPDDDNDGVPDLEDNCPQKSNQGQEDFNKNGYGDACENMGEDLDNDTVPDFIDNCSYIPNPLQDDNDSDEMGDVCDSDDDNDGVEDWHDNCVKIPNTDQADLNKNKIGDVCEADSDNDDCPDIIDKFPDDPLACKDKDQDGLGDGHEMDPLFCPYPATSISNADTDDDGLIDSVEYWIHYDVKKADYDFECNSDPTWPDTDTDGYCDGPIDVDYAFCKAGDNCINDENSGQEDTDEDDVGDVCDDDMDGDKIDNEKDNCKNVPNNFQSDTDGDGVGNACDNCTNAKNADQADGDGDGVGNACDKDSDEDGVPDTIDNCVWSHNSLQEDHDLDGVGNACDNCQFDVNSDQKDTNGDGHGDACQSKDSDGDGSPDVVDNCPDAFNPGQADVDLDGLGNFCDPDDDNCPTVKNPPVYAIKADANTPEWYQTDFDKDLVGDACDNCPSVPNPDQVNTYDSLAGDVCEPSLCKYTGTCKAKKICVGNDWMWMGFPDYTWEIVDNCGKGLNESYSCKEPWYCQATATVISKPSDPQPVPGDIDEDGILNEEDCDMDGDLVLDKKNNCYYNGVYYDEDSKNPDGDKINDHAYNDYDNDGVEDPDDKFPTDPKESKDLDGDKIGDNSDKDRDGDGVPNPEDASPYDPSYSGEDGDEGPTHPDVKQDTDGDGKPNYEDDDIDGDKVPNELDIDMDGDGVDNPEDAFKKDHTESSDKDGDKVGDKKDNCPDISNEAQADTDKDGKGNNCDDDDDNDGFLDAEDCGPAKANMNPTAVEICNNGLDDNCNSMTDENCSGDFDGDIKPDMQDNCPYIPNTNQLNSGAEPKDLGDVCKAYPYFIPKLMIAKQAPGWNPKWNPNNGCNNSICIDDSHCNPGFVCEENRCRPSGPDIDIYKPKYHDCCLMGYLENKCGADLRIWKAQYKDVAKYDSDGDGVDDDVDNCRYVPDQVGNSICEKYKGFVPKQKLVGMEIFSDGCLGNQCTVDDDCYPGFRCLDLRCQINNDFLMLANTYHPCCTKNNLLGSEAVENGYFNCSEMKIWRGQYKGDEDYDADGIFDDADADPYNAHICSDTDKDKCDDCASGKYDTAADTIDGDGNGFCDYPYEAYCYPEMVWGCDNVENAGICSEVAQICKKIETGQYGSESAGDGDDSGGGADEGSDGSMIPGDDDNDKAMADVDNCWNLYNIYQIDTDKDGYGDECDADNDGDGQADWSDNCPKVSNPDQKDSNNDTVGDACEADLSDWDSDGVPAQCDNCDDVPNSDQKNSDLIGLGDICSDYPDYDPKGFWNTDDPLKDGCRFSPCADDIECQPGFYCEKLTGECNLAPKADQPAFMLKYHECCLDEIQGNCKTAGKIWKSQNISSNMAIYILFSKPEICGNMIDDNCDGIIDKNCVEDYDGDGVNDKCDNCIFVPNPLQNPDICKDHPDYNPNKFFQPIGLIEPAKDGCLDSPCAGDNECNPGFKCDGKKLKCVFSGDKDAGMDKYKALYALCCLGSNDFCEDGKIWLSQETPSPMTIGPDQQEICNDKIDNNCNGKVDEEPCLNTSDKDGDKIVDIEDNCVNAFNPNQKDSDFDFSGDMCDEDDDNDEVLDEGDNCPFKPNADQSDSDGDGIGDSCDETDDSPKKQDPDWDNDGVSNKEDNCPYIPNPDQKDNNKDGIGNICQGYSWFRPKGINNGCYGDPCGTTKSSEMCSPGFKCDSHKKCIPDKKDRPWSIFEKLYHECCLIKDKECENGKVWKSQYPAPVVPE